MNTCYISARIELVNTLHRYPPTDEVFVCQNAGAKAAKTGLNKSATIEKISLKQADAVTHLRNASGKVDVVTIPHTKVVNPNGKSTLDHENIRNQHKLTPN